MVERKVIIEKIVTFAENKISQMSANNPMILLARPIIAKAVNKQVAKLDGILKMIQEEDGTVDVEGIMNDVIDNLLVAKVKQYPDAFGGLEIGNGSIKVGIPFINKSVVFDTNDIEEFKNSIIK